MSEKNLTMQPRIGSKNGSLRKSLDAKNDERTLVAVLDGLGRLSPDFDGAILLPLLEHASSNVRLLAAKNIGKLKDEYCKLGRTEGT